MWYIIEFQDNTIEAVPDNWLTDMGLKCYWPFHLHGQDLIEAMRNKMAPDSNFREVKTRKNIGKCGKFYLI